jgi:hypothetical protein
MLYDWLKFEDLYANLYMSLCDLNYRVGWGRKRGDPYPLEWKIILGVTAIVILMIIIWGPFVVFLTGVPLGADNPVLRMRVAVNLQLPHGSYPLASLSDMQTASATTEQLAQWSSVDLSAATDSTVQMCSMYPDSTHAFTLYVLLFCVCVALRCYGAHCPWVVLCLHTVRRRRVRWWSGRYTLPRLRLESTSSSPAKTRCPTHSQKIMYAPAPSLPLCLLPNL